MRAATSPRYAEFNFYVDPEAADLVLAAGLPLTLVPLDVTHQLVVRDETIEGRLLSLKDRRSVFLGELIRRTRHEGCGNGQLILHDPGAVAGVLWPELFTLRPFDLSVDLSHGDRRGAVSCKDGGNSERDGTNARTRGCGRGCRGHRAARGRPARGSSSRRRLRPGHDAVRVGGIAGASRRPRADARTRLHAASTVAGLRTERVAHHVIGIHPNRCAGSERLHADGQPLEGCMTFWILAMDGVELK